MKLITINTHSLEEENYEKKLIDFVNFIAEEKPDIIAMQEVNQTHDCGKEFDFERIKAPLGGKEVNTDNHALRAAQMLLEKGIKYYWKYIPIKLGYGKYDEGVAIFSLSPIEKTDIVLISGCDDFYNWKTRRALGIKTKSKWFYTVHTSWWSDKDEPFESQWKRLEEHIKDKGKVWLMGDFNNNANIRNEGYDLVLRSGWHDTYIDAENKDDGFTVTKKIDGWRDNNVFEKMRIDYIFSSQKSYPYCSKVIFNGTKGPVISDHCGVMVMYENEP